MLHIQTEYLEKRGCMSGRVLDGDVWRERQCKIQTTTIPRAFPATIEFFVTTLVLSFGTLLWLIRPFLVVRSGLLVQST